MTDLVTFLIELGTDDEKWNAYVNQPFGFIDSSDLSPEDKILLTTENNAANINQAIVDRNAGNRVEVAGAGIVKYTVTLRRSVDQ